jgi:hypothetical protein
MGEPKTLGLMLGQPLRFLAKRNRAEIVRLIVELRSPLDPELG